MTFNVNFPTIRPQQQPLTKTTNPKNNVQQSNNTATQTTRYTLSSIQQYIQPQNPITINSAVIADQYNQTKQALTAQVIPAIQNSQTVLSPVMTLLQKIRPVAVTNSQEINWNNDLKKLFQKNKAVIFALVMRSFNAKDNNGNGLIEPNKGEHIGTFTNAIERLDELNRLGINTLHLLPITPPGKKNAMGIAGSIYAPLDYLAIDPKLDDPNNPLNLKEEAKKFIQECHKRNIRVMVDLPSCASVDMYESRPELMAIDEFNRPKIPQGWEDIRMFEVWEDKSKKILNKPLLKLHKDFVDNCIELGIDGIRADVARAKPVEFWNEIINYARSKDPNFGFLAESYTYEDASPILNLPADRPEDLLNAGFDSYYGQFHIFHEWHGAKELHDHVIQNIEMTKSMPPNKSLIGSFTTHDDKSAMSRGGAPYCNLVSGLQATLPMTNPYIVSGYESGDTYVYPYSGKKADFTDTDTNTTYTHPEMLDIFNYSRKPGGQHPEIGEFFSKMLNIRNQYSDIITKGSYIPLTVKGNDNDQIIAFARHLNGRTLLVIANKNVNGIEPGKVEIPTLKSNQVLRDLAPQYGIQSEFKTGQNQIDVKLGPAKFHLFEIDTKDIEKHTTSYKQNLSV